MKTAKHINSVMLVGVLAITTIIGFGGAASAQEKHCTGNAGIDWDIQIRACTVAIRSGRWQGKDLVWAFINRGLAYKNKGQYDRAMQDYDQAIRFNPKDADSFVVRGNAYYDKKQYDQAIEDYDQAIKINPDYTLAIRKRKIAIVQKNNQ